MVFLITIILMNLRFLFLGLCFLCGFVGGLCCWTFFLMVLFYGLDYRRWVLDC